MSTYAIIQNGIVINTVVLGDNPGEWQPPEGCIAILSEDAGIGWTYVDGVFSPPEVVDPDVDLDMLALIARGRRDRLMTDVYDRGISMVLRGLRTTSSADTEHVGYLNSKLAELDSYAVDLQGIPEQEGFPEFIIWPIDPSE